MTWKKPDFCPLGQVDFLSKKHHFQNRGLRAHCRSCHWRLPLCHQWPPVLATISLLGLIFFFIFFSLAMSPCRYVVIFYFSKNKKVWSGYIMCRFIILRLIFLCIECVGSWNLFFFFFFCVYYFIYVRNFVFKFVSFALFGKVRCVYVWMHVCFFLYFYFFFFFFWKRAKKIYILKERLFRTAFSIKFEQ